MCVCMSMRVCVCMSMRVCVHEHVCVCVHEHACVCAHVRLCACFEILNLPLHCLPHAKISLYAKFDLLISKTFRETKN